MSAVCNYSERVSSNFHPLVGLPFAVWGHTFAVWGHTSEVCWWLRMCAVQTACGEVRKSSVLRTQFQTARVGFFVVRQLDRLLHSAAVLGDGTMQ